MSIVTLALIVMACAGAALSHSGATSIKGGLMVQSGNLDLVDVDRSRRWTQTTETMDLDQVLDAAVCPIVVHDDVNEHRIPRSIKNLKCGQTPNPKCRVLNMMKDCCQSNALKAHTECVNVVDHVMVRYTNRGDDTKLHKHRVHVGCTCMIREEEDAIENRASNGIFGINF